MSRMSVIRYVLPSLIVVAGLVVLVAQGFDVAALDAVVMLIAAGSSVFLLNWLYRIGASGDDVRDDEEAARRHFDEYGTWPDEDPAGTGRGWGPQSS
jgi:hypothetical protein